MKNILMTTPLGLTPIVETVSSMKLEESEEGWAPWLQTEGRGKACPLIVRATEITLKIKPQSLTVLDLGAGTGRNIKPLLEKGATVYAYDGDPESIKIIREDLNPFLNNKKLYLEQIYFQDITILLKADMIIAFCSLPFMKKDLLPDFWDKVEDAILPNGIFTGAFFGEQETIIGFKKYKLFTLTHEEVLNLFRNFQILFFSEDLEYDEEMSKKRGSDQFSHVYRVIAKKNSS